MPLRIMLPVFVAMFLLLPASLACGFELETRYATISYGEKQVLHDFNNRINLRNITVLPGQKGGMTVEDEIKQKTDLIFEQVETILEMFPLKLKFKLVLLPTDTDVQRIYQEKYGKWAEYIAFYSPQEKTMFVSVNDARLGVFSHEISHVIMDFYFKVPPPVKIHELLSQYVETQMQY